MSQTTAQSRCTVVSPDAPDAGSEVRLGWDIVHKPNHEFNANIERPTSNVQHRSEEKPSNAVSSLRRWTLDVRRSTFAFDSIRSTPGIQQISGYRHQRAYTLIEVLIVASIVVLMLGMALPVFRAITGSRSEAGASNIIASVLSRARNDAIGLDKPMGVAFVYNSGNQQSYLAEVELADCPVWTSGLQVPALGYFSSTFNGVTYYFISSPSSTTLPAPPVNTKPTAPNGCFDVGGPPIELRNDTELVPLPNGIGVQTISNCFFSTSAPYPRISDGYLNFGVILFDGNGRIVSQNYGVAKASKLSTTSGLNDDYPATGQNIGYNGQFGVPSQFGVVVFQREGFLAQGFQPTDHAYNTNTAYDIAQENWLDQNATPLLIDRYTGTLIRGD